MYKFFGHKRIICLPELLKLASDGDRDGYLAVYYSIAVPRRCDRRKINAEWGHTAQERKYVTVIVLHNKKNGRTERGVRYC